MDYDWKNDQFSQIVLIAQTRSEFINPVISTPLSRCTITPTNSSSNFHNLFFSLFEWYVIIGFSSTKYFQVVKTIWIQQHLHLIAAHSSTFAPPPGFSCFIPPSVHRHILSNKIPTRIVQHLKPQITPITPQYYIPSPHEKFSMHPDPVDINATQGIFSPPFLGPLRPTDRASGSYS